MTRPWRSGISRKWCKLKKLFEPEAKSTQGLAFVVFSDDPEEFELQPDPEPEQEKDEAPKITELESKT